MRVSFVVPTRNQRPFLRRCIESCLAQGVADSEVVVVDGASTDGTIDVLRGFSDRIRFVSEPDSGQSEAVNKGVAMATGDVIAWINSDDSYAGDGVVAAVLREFDAGADLVYGDGLLVTAAGATLRPYGVRELSSQKQLILSPSSPLLQPATFFRRALFEQVGGLDVALHFTMDYDLWLRMLPRSRRPRFLPMVLARWTLHAEAKSIQAMRAQIRETAAVRRRYRDAYGLSPAERLRLPLATARLYLYWAAVRTGLRRVA